tara:strand:- start:488 stop:724 length:237 start_codon:yes stop_codon:yes gene_type:complete
MTEVFRVTKNGNFWDLTTARNHIEALSLAKSGKADDLPADFPRTMRGQKLTAWVNGDIFTVHPADTKPKQGSINERLS